VIDGTAPPVRDRHIMGTRFRCTTILVHGVASAGVPSIYIRKRGRDCWTMAIDAKAGTFASIVKRARSRSSTIGVACRPTRSP